MFIVGVATTPTSDFQHSNVAGSIDGQMFHDSLKMSTIYRLIKILSEMAYSENRKLGRILGDRS